MLLDLLLQHVAKSASNAVTQPDLRLLALSGAPRYIVSIALAGAVRAKLDRPGYVGFILPRAPGDRTAPNRARMTG